MNPWLLGRSCWIYDPLLLRLTGMTAARKTHAIYRRTEYPCISAVCTWVQLVAFYLGGWTIMLAFACGTEAVSIPCVPGRAHS